MTVITEFLFLRQGPNGIEFRFEQHPLPSGSSGGDHVAGILDTYRGNPDVDTFWVMSREVRGHVIESWAVFPDPSPGFPAAPVGRAPAGSVAAVEEVHRAAILAADRLRGT